MKIITLNIVYLNNSVDRPKMNNSHLRLNKQLLFSLPRDSIDKGSLYNPALLSFRILILHLSKKLLAVGSSSRMEGLIL